MFGISGNSCIGIVLLRSLSRFRDTYIPCSSSNSFPIHSYTRILYYLYRKKVVYNFDQILFTHFYYQTSVKLTKLSSNQPMLSLDIYAFQYFIILVFFFFLLFNSTTLVHILELFHPQNHSIPIRSAPLLPRREINR